MLKFTLISILLILVSMSFTSEKTIIKTPENPLASCPDTPNCERTLRAFILDSATVLNAADETLRTMKAESIEWNDETKQIHAVFRIPVFGWRDDVLIAVHQDGETTTLFIRSASREGHWDIWANKIRINKFFKILNKKISS